jgi:TRAP-type transport system periplasmic protein
VKKALDDIGDVMTAEWVKSVGADGQAIINAYQRK